MTNTPDVLFDFLRNLIYSPTAVSLELDEIDPEYRKLGEGLLCFATLFNEQRALAVALSKGDLGAPLPSPENELAAPLKSLHSSLKHMTWQTQQVAKGDYSQHIDFLGEFADAFNTMIEQLSSRQSALVEEIEHTYQKSKALEQSNTLLEEITENLPQLILVIDNERNILFKNKAADCIQKQDTRFVHTLVQAKESSPCDAPFNIEFSADDSHIYFDVICYPLQWREVDASAYILSDVSSNIAIIKKLKLCAYQDSLTGLHNRFSGMDTLHKWIDEARFFTLCFIDLDNLKYVNDTFGHSEGDNYITSIAQLLQNFLPGSVACRLGGDEFMLLCPDIGESEALDKINELQKIIHEEDRGKTYYRNMSFGAVTASGAGSSASSLLSIADERMYLSKRENKKRRKSNNVLK